MLSHSLRSLGNEVRWQSTALSWVDPVAEDIQIMRRFCQTRWQHSMLLGYTSSSGCAKIKFVHAVFWVRRLFCFRVWTFSCKEHLPLVMHHHHHCFVRFLWYQICTIRHTILNSCLYNSQQACWRVVWIQHCADNRCSFPTRDRVVWCWCNLWGPFLPICIKAQ